MAESGKRVQNGGKDLCFVRINCFVRKNPYESLPHVGGLLWRARRNTARREPQNRANAQNQGASPHKVSEGAGKGRASTTALHGRGGGK